MIRVSIILISGIVFISFLGRVHLFDWDEVNFAEAAREMILTGDYLSVQINFQPFWEKPPLFIWMQVLSMKLFGINEFAARLPNAICGIITLLVLYQWGRKQAGRNFGLLWVMMFACSVLPFFYFKSGIIDPWFNLFIFLGIMHAIQYTTGDPEQKGRMHAALAGLFIGLGVLTKGPVALLIFGLTALVYWVYKKFRVKARVPDLLLFALIFILVGGAWFIILLATGHPETIREFFLYQVRLFQTKDAGHGGFVLYHFVVLFIGVFPASVFAIHRYGFRNEEPDKVLNDSRTWMMILFWTVLILFTIVKTKIVHYSSMCYFPLTFIAAYVVHRASLKNENLSKMQRILLIPVIWVWGVGVGVLQLMAMFKDKVIAMDLIDDPFAVGNLQAEVPWSGFEFLIGLIFIIAASVVIFAGKMKLVTRVFVFLGLTLSFIFATVYFITPRIEGYSQRAAIEFYKELRGKDCYVETLGFKSYAQLYYFDKPVPEKPYRTGWLLECDIDKPAYFVIKNTRSREYLEKYPELKMLYEKNGFVFTKREIPVH